MRRGFSDVPMVGGSEGFVPSTLAGGETNWGFCGFSGFGLGVDIFSDFSVVTFPVTTSGLDTCSGLVGLGLSGVSD